MVDKPPIQRVDDALAQYYQDCGRNDYFDEETGMGRFEKYAEDEGLEDNDVDEELGDDVNGPNDCLLMDIDPVFPLPMSTTDRESRDYDEFKILKHCYTHGVAPLLTWQHIANALDHELYDKISSTFMVIVNGDKRFENVNELLQEIQTERHIHQNEINYIRQLIERATHFYTKNHGTSKPNDKQMTIDMGHITDATSDGLCFDLLCDIYNVHKCFLFANYQFKHYDVNEFADHIEQCKHLNPQTKQYIAGIALEDHITTLNLYPSHIIDDDMYQICKYWFCASRIVHKGREAKNPFSLTICSIPQRVVSLYDQDVVIPFAIHDIEQYLRSKQMNAIKMRVRHAMDMNEITALLEGNINRRIAKQSSVLCVVQKMFVFDVVYIMQTKSDSFDTLQDLFSNHIIALEFNAHASSAVQCHLRYGEGRTRFYPEYLTTILSRFFTRNATLNYAQIIDKLYEDWYKHGFAVDLNDQTFNKYYKIITKYDHVSVNYNRDIIQKKTEQNRLNMDKTKKNTSKNKCTLHHTFDIEQCTFIDYIIYCLNIYKTMHANAIAFSEFDLNRLSECYTHIICVH
eukprot:242578_1